MQFNHDSLHIISTRKYYITCMHALIILHLSERREVNLIPIFQTHLFNHDYLLRLYREKYSKRYIKLISLKIKKARIFVSQSNLKTRL